MHVTDAIKKRRSIRSYLPDPVDPKIIQELVELAHLAPTAANLENRHFIVITDQKIKQKLYEAGCKQPYLLEAPVVIAVATDVNKFKPDAFIEMNKIWNMDLSHDFKKNFNVWKTIWPIQDVDAAVTTFMLAATEKGLSTCWLGTFDFEKVHAILQMPPHMKILVLITLGSMKNSPYTQKRKLIKELIHFNNW